MGARELIGGALIAATTLFTVVTIANEGIKERRLIAADNLTAGVVDHPAWCQPEIEVAIRSDSVERFRGDRIELQRMLGRVRAILQLECPGVTTVRITGLVDDVFVYDGYASSDGKWILHEIPVLLTQEQTEPTTSVGEPAAIPTPPVPPVAASSAADSKTAPQTNAVDTCDMLGAHPDDPEKPASVKGVQDEAVDTARTIGACTQAIKEEPAEPRLKFQLARAYLFADRNEEAIDLLVAAAQEGHGAALAYLGDIMLYGAGGLESEPEVAKSLYLHAVEAGFKPAAQLAADIVADAKPDATQKKQGPVKFYYPAFVNAMMAGERPRSQKHTHGELMIYASNSIAGVRHQCPGTVPNRDWAQLLMRASLVYFKKSPAEALAVSAAGNQGQYDELIQDAMDDGYSVAVSKGCNASETKNFVNAAVAYLEASQ